jgi:hypothetical protein
MNRRRLIKIATVFCVGVFLLSLLTVELHRSSNLSWFKYPGFLEADSEVAVADAYSVTVEVNQAFNYLGIPRQDVFLNQTTLFLHVYRGPPSLES